MTSFAIRASHKPLVINMPQPFPYDIQQLQSYFEESGQARFRAKQLFNWLFTRRANSFDEMTDLPLSLRQQLGHDFQLFTTAVDKTDVAEDGTRKLLVRLADCNHVECVLLRDGQRRSICVSSQVGCAMGCVFCASGLDGVERNLTHGEILEQMLHLQRLLPADERLSHIVMMGMGEPLANLDNVLKALSRASSPAGLGISPRRITISTVGIPTAIRKLASRDVRFHLAISLHAPNDELRTQLVPVNRNVGVGKLIAAADHYFEVTGRRLTFEYVLLAGINDEAEHARQLAKLLSGKNALLNVIPYNPVAGLPYKTPSANRVARFREILEAAGIVIKFRQRKGSRINAACGQLRRSTELTQLGTIEN